MALGWLLIPALGGYWFLRHCYRTRFTVERASGYHLFFQTAIAGGLLVIFAYILTSLGAFLCPPGSDLWTSFVPFPYSGTAILSALLGVVLPPVINYGYGKEEAAKRAAEENIDLIELLLAESVERQIYVELSLKSGKSYIGFALNTGLGVNSESDIAIIPALSGYRSHDTHELEITTDYAPVILDSVERGQDLEDLRDFRIVFPLSEVVSARLFDEDVYRRFQQDRDHAAYPRD